MPLGEGIGVCRGMVWLRIRRVGIGVVDGGGLGGCGWGSGVTGAEAVGFTVARGASFEDRRWCDCLLGRGALELSGRQPDRDDWGVIV